VECELLLVECRLKQQLKQGLSWGEHLALYSRVQEKVAVRGMPYRGMTIAKAEWHIAQACWKGAVGDNKADMKKQALDVHYRRAIILLSIEEVIVMARSIPWTQFK
jgi:hypothetical protein